MGHYKGRDVAKRRRARRRKEEERALARRCRVGMSEIVRLSTIIEMNRVLQAWWTQIIVTAARLCSLSPALVGEPASSNAAAHIGRSDQPD